jgi:hypothetical protein
MIMSAMAVVIIDDDDHGGSMTISFVFVAYILYHGLET